MIARVVLSTIEFLLTFVVVADYVVVIVIVVVVLVFVVQYGPAFHKEKAIFL